MSVRLKCLLAFCFTLHSFQFGMQQIDHFQGNKFVLTSDPTPRVKGVGKEYDEKQCGGRQRIISAKVCGGTGV